MVRFYSLFVLLLHLGTGLSEEESSDTQTTTSFVHTRRPELSEPEEEFLDAADMGHLETIKTLLAQKKVDINMVGTEGEKWYARTALWLASQGGHLNVVEYLLGYPGVDVNKHAVEDTWTPLHIAMSKQQKEVTLRLLKEPNIDTLIATKSNNFLPMHFAVQHGWFDVFKLLLEFDGAKDMINVKTRRGSTMFLMAVTEGRDDIFDHMLTIDTVDVNEGMWDKATPFLFACRRGRVRMAYILMRLPNFDITHTDKYGHNCLYFAVESGELEIAKMMLRTPHYTIDKAVDRHGTTLTSLATRGNNTRILNYLRQLGIDPTEDSKDNGAMSFHQAAIRKNKKLMTQMVEEGGIDVNIGWLNGESIFYAATNAEEPDMEWVKYVRGLRGVDINRPTSHQLTPLYQACQMDVRPIVEYLLDDPVIDVNAGGFGGFGPLHISVKRNRVKVLKMLVKHPNIKINQQTSTGHTAAHLAASHNHPWSMKILMFHKDLDLTLKNHDGDTAMDLAKKHNAEDAIKRLEKYYKKKAKEALGEKDAEESDEDVDADGEIPGFETKVDRATEEVEAAKEAEEGAAKAKEERAAAAKKASERDAIDAKTKLDKKYAGKNHDEL